MRTCLHTLVQVACMFWRYVRGRRRADSSPLPFPPQRLRNPFASVAFDSSLEITTSAETESAGFGNRAKVSRSFLMSFLHPPTNLCALHNRIVQKNMASHQTRVWILFLSSTNQPSHCPPFKRYRQVTSTKWWHKERTMHSVWSSFFGMCIWLVEPSALE